MSGVILSLVSLCPAVFLGNLPLKMEFFEHAPIQYRSTLNTKKVPHNLTELLPKFGNFLGHRFRVMNFFIHNHDFMLTRFEFRHILVPCANGYPKILPT
jgi:hypothetical protein